MGAFTPRSHLLSACWVTPTRRQSSTWVSDNANLAWRMFSPQMARKSFTTAVVTPAEVQRKPRCDSAYLRKRPDQSIQSQVVTKRRVLNEVLREGREQTKPKLTQGEVAAVLGKTQQAVGAYEAGTRIPRALDLGLMARMYQLYPADLQVLAKEAKAARRNAKVRRIESDASPADRMIMQLRMVIGALTEQVDELAEAVDFLQKERTGTAPRRRG